MSLICFKFLKFFMFGAFVILLLLKRLSYSSYVVPSSYTVYSVSYLTGVILIYPGCISPLAKPSFAQQDPPMNLIKKYLSNQLIYINTIKIKYITMNTKYTIYYFS